MNEDTPAVAFEWMRPAPDSPGPWLGTKLGRKRVRRWDRDARTAITMMHAAIADAVAAARQGDTAP